MSEALRRFASVGFALAFALLLGACTQKVEFKNVDITGASFAKDFALTDAAGSRRTLADYRGKAVAIFFGYTQCPDVCPTTMFEMSEVMKQLGADADKVQVLFVTIDPERDTPTLLSQYVPAFDPRFVGLTGTPDEVAKMAQDFKVFYRKVPSSVDPKFYTMDHFAGMYLFDPQGRVRVLVQYGQKPESITADLKTLLKAG